jgi:hypothetical protein
MEWHRLDHQDLGFRSQGRWQHGEVGVSDLAIAITYASGRIAGSAQGRMSQWGSRFSDRARLKSLPLA